MQKISKRRDKRVFFYFFGPWLTQASLWLAWALKLLRGEGTNSLGRASLLQNEASTRLGELPWFQRPFLAINRRDGG